MMKPGSQHLFSKQICVLIAGDKVNTEFENGVVTLTLPKAGAIRPKTIPVKVKQT